MSTPLRIVVQEVDLQHIDRNKAMELIAEINKANVDLKPLEYPALRELKKLLQGMFDSYKSGVHYIEKN